MLITKGFGSGKTNSLFHLIDQNPDICKTYLYIKDPCEVKHEFLIDKQKSTALEHFNDPKAFIEYWNDMDGIYENIEEYHPNRQRKIFFFLLIWLLLCLVIKSLIL